MKTKYYIFGAALFSMMGFGLTSCDNEEFLDVDQYDNIAIAAMFESDANAKKGLNGVYDMCFPNDSYDGDWGFKPNFRLRVGTKTGTHRTGMLLRESCSTVGSMYMPVSAAPTTIWKLLPPLTKSAMA